MKVTLSDKELTVIGILGGMRSLTARSHNVTDRKKANLRGEEIDRDGLIAEYAFCKHFNVFPDLVPSPRSGSYDCQVKGQRVDIKSTRHKNGRLLATLKNNEDVDVYVLAIIDENEVEFIGWVYKNELCRQENIKDLGYGKGYCLDRSKLRSFKD